MNFQERNMKNTRGFFTGSVLIFKDESRRIMCNVIKGNKTSFQGRNVKDQAWIFKDNFIKTKVFF